MKRNDVVRIPFGLARGLGFHLVRGATFGRGGAPLSPLSASLRHRKRSDGLFPPSGPAASASLLDRLPKRLSDRAVETPSCLASLFLSAWLSSDADMM